MIRIHGRQILRQQLPAVVMLLIEQRDAYKQQRDVYRNEVLRLQAELRRVTNDLRELRMTVLARHRADAELAGLYRERQIQLARAAVRNLMQPLH
jgi:hypothetical protein